MTHGGWFRFCLILKYMYVVLTGITVKLFSSKCWPVALTCKKTHSKFVYVIFFINRVSPFISTSPYEIFEIKQMYFLRNIYWNRAYTIIAYNIISLSDWNLVFTNGSNGSFYFYVHYFRTVIFHINLLAICRTCLSH